MGLWPTNGMTVALCVRGSLALADCYGPPRQASSASPNIHIHSLEQLSVFLTPEEATYNPDTFEKYLQTATPYISMYALPFAQRQVMTL